MERVLEKGPGRHRLGRVSSAQTLGGVFLNSASWPHGAGFWPTLLSSCLIPNRWVSALPPPGSESSEGPPAFSLGRKASWGVAPSSKHPSGPGWEVQTCISHTTGGPGPTPVHTTVTARGHVATATQMLPLPHKTVSPAAKHVDSGPSSPSLNPALPKLCWAPSAVSRNLSVPFPAPL